MLAGLMVTALPCKHWQEHGTEDRMNGPRQLRQSTTTWRMCRRTLCAHMVPTCEWPDHSYKCSKDPERDLVPPGLDAAVVLRSQAQEYRALESPPGLSVLLELAAHCSAVVVAASLPPSSVAPVT